MPKPTADVHAFWQALQRADGEAMSRCYAADATFEDPVFQLKGPQIGAMWRMLLPRQAKVEIQTLPLEVRGDHASGRWEARYVFTATGRTVHNRIHSRFRLREGKIVHHVDSFSFWRWSRMALGAKGLLLGWTPLVRDAVRTKARRSLERTRKTN